MPVSFPPARTANEDGLLAIGGRLDVETLTLAYQQGIFPWPVSEDFPLTWFAPNPRGVLFAKDIHIPRSLKKSLKKKRFDVGFNQDFELIVKKCAMAKRKHEKGTWINQEILEGYTQLFQANKAYCVGVYNEGKLVGGLYGVCIGEIISGESMFHDETNASKAALVALLEVLREKNIPFLDTQMVTPVIASFGGREIDRDNFMEMLGRLNAERPRKEIFGS